MSKKKVDQTYQKLTPREHVLHRPDTYVGRIEESQIETWTLSNLDIFNPELEFKSINYHPAVIKIFDEIITNAIDHAVRPDTKVKKICIDFDIENNIFTVGNDGQGIPIEVHSEHNIWIPELIFGHLLAGSNFDDTEQRYGGGRNGLGAKLTAIFSQQFTVETRNKKKYYKQSFYNNLAKVDKPLILNENKKLDNNLSTIISFKPDWEKLKSNKGLTQDTQQLLYKRILDACVSCSEVKFYFNGQKIENNTFKDWVNLHTDSPIFETINEKYRLALSPTDQPQNVLIVNGITCHRGGTLVDGINNQVAQDLRQIFPQKIQNKINLQDIKNSYNVFLIARISNPEFDTQTKETLKNNYNNIKPDWQPSSKLLKSLKNGPVGESIIEKIKEREAKATKKQFRSAKKKSIHNLIDCQSKNIEERELWIFEGQSAGSAFRQKRNPQTQAAFFLRGKFINVKKMTPKQIVENEEAKNLMLAIGLSLTEKVDINKINYKSIYICTDSDLDGNSITGLLINFFWLWPELYKNNIIQKVITPLFVAYNKKERKWFYNFEEYQQFEKDTDISKWSFEYKKGLASLENFEYEQMLNNPKSVTYNPIKTTEITLNKWFGKSSEDRKQIILENQS